MTLPANYYNRFDPAKNYEQHLFLPGRALQSAELNELQSLANTRIKDIADALFKDGDIIRDCGVLVDRDTGDVTCQAGAIYIRGMVRGVTPTTLNVPATGTFAIGIRLVESVVTVLEDPDLRDPATGTRNYDEPGAERLEVVPQWAIGTNIEANFFPVYSVTDRVLSAKEPPPAFDAITQSLARYDRDSSGGSYVVSGLAVKALPDDGANQVYTMAEGRARVYGFGLEFPTARRITLAATPDLKTITNEPHLSSVITAQRVNLDRTPAANISAVSITAEKTVTLTHGVFTGAQDPLPDTSVLQVLEVKQGATTYTPTTDYILNAGKIDWTPGGAEPSPGSTYTVKYQYITLATPTDVDDTGFTVTGAVAGTLILVTYNQKLPRIDRLCINTKGEPIWLLGVAAEYNPQPPLVPDDLLPLARVYQTWTAARSVTNDGVRVVAMPQLAAIDGRMDWLAQLIAQNRLESNIHTRESGTKKGLFTDPFLDDSQRDAGTVQNAAIVRGELLLPIDAAIYQLSSDITSPATLTYSATVGLNQPLRTGSMKINAYMAFDPVPAVVKLSPAVDRWTDVQSTWLSPSTQRFVVGSGQNLSVTSQTRDALVNTSYSVSETLRTITVNYTASGFGPGEVVSSVVFDGVSRPTGGATANSSGVVSGSFTIPAGIPSGSKQVEINGAGGSHGTATFTGQGTIERQVWQQQTTVTETRWQSPPPPQPVVRPVDPVAQTFTMPANTQVCGVDLWFVDKPTTKTRVQIRGTSSGVPNQTVLAEAVLEPADIVSGGASTRANFEAPAHLLGGAEYALVVLCNDATGSVAVAELGKFDVNAQRWITSQPYTVGVMLSSSNASTWTAHQDRDLAFRILKADFSGSPRTIDLGHAAVAGATDLLLMSYAERPASVTGVEYVLTLPDSSTITVSDGQPVQLAAAITGNVQVSAKLSGDADFSPVLMPGTQLVAGVVQASATYVTRAIPGGASVTAKVIYEAVVPSGATVTVHYKGTDIGDTWTTVPQTATRNVDDGFVEFTHSLASINEVNGIQIRLTLTGTTAARPRVRDLRAIVV